VSEFQHCEVIADFRLPIADLGLTAKTKVPKPTKAAIGKSKMDNA